MQEIETRSNKNAIRYKATINRVTSNIQGQDLKRGRVRPKDPVEEKILARFTRK